MGLKHVGRVKSNQKRVVVAYRVVPGEPESCLVVMTESLTADEHDALMKAVESDAGQSAYEFGEAMARAQLPDGRNMLAGFHTTGKMQKVPTNLVEMIPDRQSTVSLDELNRIIAEQKGVSIEDLALQDTTRTAPTVEPEEVDLEVQTPVEGPDAVLTDEQLAAQYRSQADAMFKEAKRLREQAEELMPTKKAKSKTATSA